MRILAIETSCDETGIALLEGVITASGFEFTLLGAAALNSQAKLHAEYGGVFPNLAKREHEKNLPIILKQALDQAGNPDVNAIAVTQGPGLEPALWTGIEFAKKLATELGKPLLLTNHMEGHLISSLVQDGKLEDVQLPVLALLISGGHTEFALMREWYKYEIVGQTLDDAVGEAFDKVARMLGLPYPGGPQVSKLARAAREQGLQSTTKLPRPMLQHKDCNLSFSGLKTAVLYALRDRGGIQKLSSDEIGAFAREFEDTIGDVLVEKTRRALEETSARTFVIGGGVAANTYLRERLQKFVTDEFPDVEMRLPDLLITGDNGVMIAQAALARALSGLDDTPKGEVRAYSNRFSILAPK
ncbi:MAG: tRNA (adenosine(37)-N6)-threonylcarbamoyltransferase complex transferase subunit TsaD [Candidatus Pacebacteria bacterium]|nr:tRNA (adenosine(37)-N6)-threonylcarbamoyltransferase complex transferase subunit TsaD [Candidatus Paceibacterota bacterium]